MSLALKTWVFALCVPGSVAVWVPLWLTRDVEPNASLFARVGGAALVIMGVAVFGWCAYDFVTSGRGTPAPIDAPRRLVVRGLYRHVRNPMYVGMAHALLGWVLIAPAPRTFGYAAVVLVLFHLFVVLHEEPHLSRRFGDEYDAYCARVPRWWPRWSAES